MNLNLLFNKLISCNASRCTQYNIYDLLINPTPYYFIPLAWNYYFYYTAGVISSSMNINVDEVHSDIPTSIRKERNSQKESKGVGNIK